MTVLFSGCSKNTDVNDESILLVGHWAEEQSSIEQLQIVFNADATGSIYFYNCTSNKIIDERNFKYAYNKSDMIITLTYTSVSSFDGSGYKGEIEKITLTYLEKNEMDGTWGDYGRFSLVKQ